MINEHVAEIAAENEALFKQLHLVQEELERLYTERQESAAQGGVRLQWVDDELPSVLADNQRLQLVIETQKKMLAVESNSLACRLGGILIQNMRAGSGLMMLARKLWKEWRLMNQKTPPEVLGGVSFSAVVRAYEQGSMTAVDKLLDTAAISFIMRANAYTALARHLLHHNMKMAAEAASRAYETDPRPYRLKWLGFRLYDVGSILEAEAVMALLPLDISLSESEARQAERIRLEAKQIREERARSQSDYKLRKEAVEKRVHELTLVREQVHALAGEHAAEIERLLAEQAEIENHKAEIEEIYHTQLLLVDKQHVEIEKLLADKAELEHHKAKVEEEHRAQVLLANKCQAELRQSAQALLEMERAKTSHFRRISELELHVADLVRERDRQIFLANHRLCALSSALEDQKNTFEELFGNQSNELRKIQNFLDGCIRQETAGAIRQIEASLVLQQYFSTGRLSGVSLERDTWPVASDFALYLVECIEQFSPDIIIEFGSGVSTTVVAKALSGMQHIHQDKPIPRFVSFEHLELYYIQANANINRMGLNEFVHIILSPLHDYVAPNGLTYQYYTCQQVLKSLASSSNFDKPRLLVIVDGPPSHTGTHARFPALPIVLQHFCGAHIDVLLDDYIRDDEREVVELWRAECAAAGLPSLITEKKLIKGACLLRITPFGAGGTGKSQRSLALTSKSPARSK